MNSPASKKLNFKMKKYNFPATIDEEQIKRKQQNSTSGSDFNLRIGKSKKSFSLFIFRRSSSTLMDSRLSNNSLQDENSTEESLHMGDNHESFSGENGSIASINSKYYKNFLKFILICLLNKHYIQEYHPKLC